MIDQSSIADASGFWPEPQSIPIRRGGRPATTSCAPHSQLDQFPTPMLSDALIARLAALPGVIMGSSRRAPPGTTGLHLMAGAKLGSARAFLMDREFAHVHPDGDGSLHLVLPEPVRSQALAAGWAEPHPMAGQPTVSPDTVMVYAPRDEAEMDVVVSIVEASWRNAAGEDGH